MSKKIGRPISENKKNYLLQVRLDSETLIMLEKCVKKEKTSKSEIVRKGINIIYDDIKK